MSALQGHSAPAPNRRVFLQTLLGAGAALGLSACTAAAASGPALSSSAPLPSSLPTGTSLSVASALGAQQLQLQLSGLIRQIPFTVSSWPNIAAGPDVINAFRAHSLDLANNAGIPPIQAHYQGYDARIVALDLTRKPSYLFATKPHSDIRTVAQFAGRRLAFSQGQAQGVVLLRALHAAGLKDSDVQLVPLTSDQFLTALEAGQVDIAPLAISQALAYLNRYAADGAHTIDTAVVDLLNLLWAPAEVLADADKAAAVAAFVPIWAKGLVWVYENPSVWEQEYYVKTQNISLAQAQQVTALSNKPLLPPSWDEAIAWEQQTIDLLAQGGYVKSFRAETLFDRRFEHLAAAAVPVEYRS
ncbi:ABC transporter substrate-binding protein [Streptacidiphilus pinicola]|uniref:ABC transporter substrate-binding protein n=1 Tax=Streptacidiphilus pinicola TaxID=2219663 RepID=A0A2X0IL46_9ACTN|nr:ABC transporter substrate-binding protein [Streptacidiphilus pinicola]RAG85834.1 ABC transporter substrate-binding protein [Streptacidiphilus pinicola]